MVILTPGGDGRRLVELVRCSVCGLSEWRVEGSEATRDAALGALSATFAPTAATRASRVRKPPVAPAAPPARSEAELADLLAGWQVHGTQR